MKTIGLIGGLTWLSTLDYYRLLNEKINEKLGGVESGRIILYSVNFAEIKILTENGQWDAIANIMIEAARKLEQAGSDCIIVGANTMHKIADEIQQSINIPLIHIAEVTARQIKKQELHKVALLGTKYTMQFDFYKKKLADLGIHTIIPGNNEIEMINTAIYSEMSKGNFLPVTKQRILAVIEELVKKGAEGVILGCTEIPILIKQEDCKVPVFDTTQIHANAAVAFALSDPTILARDCI